MHQSEDTYSRLIIAGLLAPKTQRYLEVVYVPLDGSMPTRYGLNVETSKTYATVKDNIEALTQVCGACKSID